MWLLELAIQTIPWYAQRYKHYFLLTINILITHTGPPHTRNGKSFRPKSVNMPSRMCVKKFCGRRLTKGHAKLAIREKWIAKGRIEDSVERMCCNYTININSIIECTVRYDTMIGLQFTLRWYLCTTFHSVESTGLSGWQLENEHRVVGR